MKKVLEEFETIAIGAESQIRRGKFLNFPVIIKHRIEKKFRVKEIDLKLRKERTIQEIRLLQAAKANNVNVPFVLDVDKSKWKIVMDEVLGSKIKDLINHPEILQYFNKLGNQVGLLHKSNIIHGDLTTSNIIVDKKGEVWLIDFGLGHISTHLEDRSVDLLVFKHILESSHPQIAKTGWDSFLLSYFEVVNEKQSVMKRMNKIEQRVRYKSH